jgi:hypothetical protein
MDINEAVAIVRDYSSGRYTAVDLYDARKCLADAYLATLREDDGDPITAEWLLSIGWVCRETFLGSSYYHDPHEVMLCFVRGVIEWVNYQLPQIATRGQLRDLLEVLGVGDE